MNQIEKKIPSVYFITVESSDGLFVKIGEAGNAWRRLDQHIKRYNIPGNTSKLRQRAVVRGTRSDETSIHAYFSEDRYIESSDTETFHATDKVLGYVRWIRDQSFTWVPDEDFSQPLDSLPAVDFSSWRPSESRQKVAAPDLFCTDPFKLPERALEGDDYFTALEILEPARMLFGGSIGLDPASHPAANANVNAEKFHTKTDNGLLHPWHGNVWLSPPLSQWMEWIPKSLQELNSGNTQQLCILIPSRATTSKQVAPALCRSDALCKIHGRIPSLGPKGSKAPDDGQEVLYFGNNVGGFRDAFSVIGTVYAR